MSSESFSSPDNHTYIPPSVQKSMEQHINRNMPGHLKKYQQQGHLMPRHGEEALKQHVQKSLPGHLKQYTNAYMHQNVMHPTHGPSNSSAPSTANEPQTAPVAGYNGPRYNQYNPNLSPQPNKPQTVAPSPASGPSTSPSGDPYEFIMNPEQPSRRPVFTPGGTKQRIIIVVMGLILLIVLANFVNSFLSSSGNEQRDKLLKLAQTQNEIIRVSEEAQDRITDKNFLNQVVSVRYSVISSQKEVVAALSKRGKEAKEKDLRAGVDAKNDAALTEGEQNQRFDQTYKELLENQLQQYQQQLEAVYNSGNTTEKEAVNSSNQQINLLLKRNNPA